MKELEWKRTEFSKTFIRDDGKYVYRSSLSPMHFLRHGKWVDFKPRFVENKGIVRLYGMPYGLETLKDEVGFVFTNSSDGSKSTVVLRNDLLNINKSTKNVETYDRGIYWHNVFPGTDIYLECRNTEVEFFKVVHSPDAVHELTWQVDCENPASARKMNDDAKGWDAEGDPVNIELTTRPTTRPDGLSMTVTEKFGKASKIQDPKTRIRKSSDPVYPLLIDMPTISDGITSTANDRYANRRWAYTETPVVDTFDFNDWTNVTGVLTNTATNQIKVGHWVYFYRYPANLFARLFMFNGCFYWPSVDIDKDTVITSANIEVNMTSFLDWNGNQMAGPLKLKMYGDLISTPPQWGSGNDGPFVLETRKVGTGDVHTITSGTATGPQTYNVTAAVQEIVNQAGWSSGNPMRFFLGDGQDKDDLPWQSVQLTATAAAEYSTLYAYFADSSATPGSTTLTIVYGSDAAPEEYGWGLLPIS